MKKWLLAVSLLLMLPNVGLAHFGSLIVTPPMLEQPAHNELVIQLAFCHPRAAEGMNMVKPAAFAVWHNNKTIDLLPTVREKPLFNALAWTTLYKAAAPGDHIFYMSPQPYWEEAEQCFIVHHTKTIVNVFDMQDAWDHVIGLPVEIIPLTRPYGLYAGNSLTGQVLQNGKPLANCQVEIEFLDPNKQKPAISEALITQVVKTDSNGCFSWAFPWAGWWGISALAAGGEMTHNGRTAQLEVGGVLWIYLDELPGK